MSSVKARFGILSTAITIGFGLASFSVAAVRGDAAAIAMDYLGENKQTLGLLASDAAEAVVSSITPGNRANGVTHVYLQQRYQGLAVWNGIITVNILSDGTAITPGSRFVTDIATLAGGQKATIGIMDATAVAVHSLGLKTTQPLQMLGRQGGPSQRATVSGGGVTAKPIDGELVWFPADEGSVHLAWKLEIDQADGEHWWYVFVDATDGRFLDRHDLIVHDDADAIAAAVRRPGQGSAAPTDIALFPPTDGATYSVFPIPMESPSDGARQSVVNAPNPNASPFGWHDTNAAAGAEFTVTRGNNVDAYADRDANNSPDPGSSPDGGPALNFNFALDFAAQPVASQAAAVTNLFYWNNIMHDVTYHYGFDEASGNFQVNNYGHGGSQNDDVRAEAQDGSGTNNANFSTPVDGSRPRMQMFEWINPTPGATTPRRDSDFDAGVIAHEYGHGISNRLTGGRLTTTCLRNAEQMGEGWSDWFALTLTAVAADTATTPRGLGTYLRFQPADGPGIRPTPYTTDTTVNPSTYASVADTANISAPHGIGYVWNTMLWEMYWNLVDKHGFNPNIYDSWTTGGNNLAFQLVIDGLKFQPCGPGFVDGRDAILAADVALTGGNNQCEIWRGFAKRGLGVSASQGSANSRTDGVAAFDLPAMCAAPVAGESKPSSGAGGQASLNNTIPTLPSP